MFTGQLEKCAEPHIIALVELDMQKMRVRFALARETIRERMQELEHPKVNYGGPLDGSNRQKHERSEPPSFR